MASDLPTDSFWSLLRQSGLLAENQLAALEAELGGSEGSQELANELVKRSILTDWQAENLLQGKHKGFRLGPYRILKPLGQGGMSRVYLGEHEVMHRRSAIKVLPSKYQADPDLLNRFRLEARAVGALDHPHIVRAYDFNKEESYGKQIYYLVMEFVDGQDLRRMVDEQGPLDYRKAADFIAQAAEGLAHAHEAGFVHRDIKPANLLVDANGVLKILDLGLARFTIEGDNPWETLEADPSAVGTADYVPPEQVADPRSVDGRSDIYSLGLTFYFLLTGHRPFPKPTLVEVLMAHRTEQPEPILDLRPDVPFELIEIIDRMIAKAPLARYQTAKDVAEALRRFLSDSPSGREYSRISELMAAAMRAKQPPPSDGKEEEPKAKAAELELAAIDDDVRKTAESTATAKVRRTSAGESGKLPPAKRPPSGDSKRTLPKQSSDVFSDLLPAELTSVRSPVPSHPQWKRGRRQTVLQSPFVWVGAAIVVVVVAIALLTLSSSSSNKDKRPSAPGSAPPTARVPKPSAAAPVPQLSEAERALAGVVRMRVPYRVTGDPNLNSWFNQTIIKQVRATTSEAGIERVYNQDSPTVFDITVKIGNDSQFYTVDLSVELRVTSSGRTVTAWKLERQIVNLPRQGLRQKEATKALQAGVSDFFGQFVAAVRQARAKAQAK